MGWDADREFSRREHHRATEAARWQREAGLQAELLDPDLAGEVQPGVTSRAISYVWLPAEGQVDSQRLAASLGDAIACTEVRLIKGNSATQIRSRDGAVTAVAMADGRELHADQVILAAGAWSASIRGLPQPLPIRPVRGQMLRYPRGALALEHIVAPTKPGTISFPGLTGLSWQEARWRM